MWCSIKVTIFMAPFHHDIISISGVQLAKFRKTFLNRGNWSSGKKKKNWNRSYWYQTHAPKQLTQSEFIKTGLVITLWQLMGLIWKFKHLILVHITISKYMLTRSLSYYIFSYIMHILNVANWSLLFCLLTLLYLKANLGFS